MEKTKQDFSKKKLMIIFISYVLLMFGLNMVNAAENTNTFTFSDSGIAVESESGSGYKIEGTSLTINEAGTYTITGNCNEGSIKVKKETTGVTLILKDLTLASSTTAPISLNKTTDTTIEIIGTVSLTDNEDITTEDTNEDFEGACIKVKSGASLNLKGTGTLNIDGTNCKNGIKGAATSKITVDGEITLNIKAANNGLAADGSTILNGGTFIVEAEDAIKCDPDDDDTESLGDLTINGGTYKIKASSDGIRANGKLEINGGTFDITAGEGLEATYVLINDGTIMLNSTDDGINASSKSTRYSIKVEVNGGDITIKMGQGDTDAIDSNGDLIINGGKLNITAQSAFDYDGKAEYNGGTLIVNGTQINSISNQFMGGFGGRGQGGKEQDMQRPNWNNQNEQGMQRTDRNNQNGQGMIPPDMNNSQGMIRPNKNNGKNTRNRFIDVEENAWYSSAVDYATKSGIMNGVSEDMFEPNSNLTRGMLVTVLYRLARANESGKAPFNDVNSDAYYSLPVAWASKNAIVNGVGNNQFAPEQNISREDLATIIYRFAKQNGNNFQEAEEELLNYIDVSEISEYANEPIRWCVKNSILNGKENNTIDAKGLATRAETSTIIQRLVNYMNK